MPVTTSDDSGRPRRRLGGGPSALPAAPGGDMEAAGQGPVAPEPADIRPAGGPADADEAAPEQAEQREQREWEPEADPEPAVRPEPEAEEAPAAVRAPVPVSAPDAEAGPGPVAAEPEPVGRPGPAPVPGPDTAAGPPEGEPAADSGTFTVRLANFEGPFDLLLQLISKHKLDVTEVALSKVTNEFMTYIHAMGPDWDLDQTTEFLVVAATLLDLKAARLLPAAEVEDEADLALLEARDLLFARLLQYRAYKQIAAIFAERLEQEALRHPRTVGLEPQHAELLPEVVLSIGADRFAQLAVKAMQPRPKPQVYVDHIHAPLVSVREQAEHVIALLRELGAATFGELTADAADTLTVVARFLALLELYREKAIALDQEEALGTLQVRWTGDVADTGQPLVTDEFDREAAAEPEPAGKGEQS